MHRVFAGEWGFEDKELRTIQSTSKRGAHLDPVLPEPQEASIDTSPSAHTNQDKAA